jgi:hypothetical protein
VHTVTRQCVALPSSFDPPQPGRRANCRVPRTVPQFAAMTERAKDADPAEWRWCPDGIRVPISWLERGRDPRTWTPPTDLKASPQLTAAMQRWGVR